MSSLLSAEPSRSAAAGQHRILRVESMMPKPGLAEARKRLHGGMRRGGADARRPIQPTRAGSCTYVKDMKEAAVERVARATRRVQRMARRRSKAHDGSETAGGGVRRRREGRAEPAERRGEAGGFEGRRDTRQLDRPGLSGRQAKWRRALARLAPIGGVGPASAPARRRRRAGGRCKPCLHVLAAQVLVRALPVGGAEHKPDRPCALFRASLHVPASRPPSACAPAAQLRAGCSAPACCTTRLRTRRCTDEHRQAAYPCLLHRRAPPELLPPPYACCLRYRATPTSKLLAPRPAQWLAPPPPPPPLTATIEGPARSTHIPPDPFAGPRPGARAPGASSARSAMLGLNKAEGPEVPWRPCIHPLNPCAESARCCVAVLTSEAASSAAARQGPLAAAPCRPRPCTAAYE